MVTPKPSAPDDPRVTAHGSTPGTTAIGLRVRRRGDLGKLDRRAVQPVGYSHLRELTRTASVSRGNDSVWEIPARHIDLDQLVVVHDGEEFTYTEMLHATYRS